MNIPITLHGDVSTDSITRPGGYGTLKLGSVLELTQVEFKLNEDDDMQEKRCAHCKEGMDPDHPTQVVDGDDVCEDNDDGPHAPEWSPLTWAKNIAVTFDEEQDMIELAIATGEPRGGWTMRLYRNSNGVVIMHLPHEGMNGPHEPIKQMHPGTFVVG